MSDARTRVVVVSNDLGAGIEGIVLRLNKMMGEMQEHFAVRIRTCPRAACEELISLSVADLTAESFVASKDAAPRSPPTGEVASAWGDTLKDLDVVLS